MTEHVFLRLKGSDRHGRVWQSGFSLKIQWVTSCRVSQKTRIRNRTWGKGSRSLVCGSFGGRQMSSKTSFYSRAEFMDDFSSLIDLGRSLRAASRRFRGMPH